MNSKLKNTIDNKDVRHAAEILRTVCSVLAVTLQLVVLTILLHK